MNNVEKTNARIDMERRLVTIDYEVKLIYEMMDLGLSHKTTCSVIKKIAKKTRINEAKEMLINNLGEGKGKEIFNMICSKYGVIF